MSPGELYFTGTVIKRMQKNIMIGKNGMRTFENIKSFYRNNCESMMESLCQHFTVQRSGMGSCIYPQLCKEHDSICKTGDCRGSGRGTPLVLRGLHKSKKELQLLSYQGNSGKFLRLLKS